MTSDLAGHGRLRIGIVCPYSIDAPGGVQAHVRDLAEALIGLGHYVSVLAPADNEKELPPYVVSVGRAVGIPYNGAVGRVAFGPITLARVRRWLKTGFDVLHLHEPTSPSVSMLACLAAKGPIVATFHMASQRSWAVAAAHAALQPIFEKITGRIAVSALARKFQVEHLDGGGVEVPNGVATARFAHAEPLPGWPGEGGTLGFLGRFTEPRKGFGLLIQAFAALAVKRPGLRLLVAGPGEADEALAGLPPELRPRVVMLGKISDSDKVRMLHSVDIYVAPNTGGESFGIILTEAMAAGAAVVASDLEAFRRVLGESGQAGILFPVGDVAALTTSLDALLDDPAQRTALARCGQEVVQAYDWSSVAQRVLEVYHSAIDATASPVTVDRQPTVDRLADELTEELR